MHSAPQRLPVTASLDDPLYYLTNFRFVLAWVVERYPDLLDAGEHHFVSTFEALPQPAQALLVRMVMRKGTRFRTAKLRYVEIGEPEAALTPLVALGWVDADPELDLADLFGVLTKAEVVQALSDEIAALGISPKQGKAALFEVLALEELAPRGYAQWWPAAPDRVVDIRMMETCDRLRLMFFGNLRQDWAEFVLTELGLQRFEQVEFLPESRAFQARDEVDAYLHLHRLRERFEAGEPLRALWAEVPTTPPDNAWLTTRRGKLLYRLAREAERQGDSEMAEAIYPACLHPEARVRYLRLLERQGAFEAAYPLVRAAYEAPANEAERQALTRLMPRVCKRLGITPPPTAPAPRIERIDLTLPQPVGGSVEGAVCEHLSTDDAPVRYVENTLLGGLFGLLCWRAIFAPLPGAFFHPFHGAPADLGREDFVSRRRELFTACLAELDDGLYQATIRETWQAKHGLASPFVHWGVLDETLLEQALACLPAADLKACFLRLLDDIKANRAGLPDLIQLWPDQQRYRLIEVKGPGDRLQDNQHRWLAHFTQHGMPVAVCYVQWQDREPQAAT